MASGVVSLASGCRLHASTILLGLDSRRNILKSTALVGLPHAEEKFLSKQLFPVNNQPLTSIPMAERPIFMDVQDAHPDSILFSFGAAEQSARHENIFNFFFSEFNKEVNIDDLLLSDLMGFKTMVIDLYGRFCCPEIGVHDADHVLLSERLFHIPRPQLEFIINGSNASDITFNPDSRFLITGSESKIKDLLSVAIEFNLLKSFTTSNKQSMVVPYFTRSPGGHSKIRCKASIVSNQILAPSKRPENMKLKPLPKKQPGKNAVRERALNHNNYFRAFENLLSVVADKKRINNVALSLKKSGPEIAKLLSHFAAGIAGIGLAILLSVAYRAATGTVPLISSLAEFLNAGLGIGFLWLSLAVNALREAVFFVSRSSTKLKITEEMIGKVDRCANEVLYRTAVVSMMAILRFL